MIFFTQIHNTNNKLKLVLVVLFYLCSKLTNSQNNTKLNNTIIQINRLLQQCEMLTDTSSEKAEQYSKKALQLSRGLSNKTYFYQSMLALSKALWAQGGQTKSAYYIDSLERLSTSIKDNQILSDIRFVKGRYEHFKGMHDNALNDYFEALNYSEKAKDNLRIGEISNTIGGIYYNQEQSTKAYQWYRKSLSIQFLQKNIFRIARGYLNTGSALAQQNKLQQSKLLLDSSLYYYSLIASTEGKAYVYATLPIVFTKQNQTDSALKYLTLARELIYSINKMYSLPEINYQIATIYFKKNDFKNAIKYINEGLAYCKKTRLNFFQLSLYQLKSQLLEQTKQYKEALECHKLYKVYSDSVLNNESTKKQTQAELKYEYNKKRFEEQLKADEITAKRKAEEKIRNIIIYSFLIVILVASLFIYLRYRAKKRTSDILANSNEKLKEKNLIIEENSSRLKSTLAERELLLKEIHHRVKNNLQIISGLLELQKEELSEESSKAAFDEGQSRVRSIALIHQNLYQHENLGSIEFKAFVKDLAANVKEVFESTHYEMTIEINVPDKAIDIDTAVPLGLIINELLTNSYKYATKKDKTGKILIHLTDKLGGNFELIYADDGPGIKPEINFHQSTSLGLRLIKGLTKQLAGNVVYNNNGLSEFKIVFKDAYARQLE